MHTKPPKAVDGMPYYKYREGESSATLSQVDNHQTVHFTQTNALNSAMLTASTFNRSSLLTQTLSIKDRQLLIAGLLGEYQGFCHFEPTDNDMTPEQHYAKLLTYSDAELLEDSDVLFVMTDTGERLYSTIADYYNTHSSFCPYEYQID